MDDLYISSVDDVRIDDVEMEGAEKVRIQWLVSKETGPNFALRRFILGPGGHTPFHTHAWEHEVYVLRGQGSLVYGEDRQKNPIAPGNVSYVPACAVHQFRNEGDGDFEFLCIIPVEETNC
jgi:quercetin dioxygenase-like cupin family protein